MSNFEFIVIPTLAWAAALMSPSRIHGMREVLHGWPADTPGSSLLRLTGHLTQRWRAAASKRAHCRRQPESRRAFLSDLWVTSARAEGGGEAGVTVRR